MDVRHSHGTDVYVVRACYEDDAADLIAVAGAHSVEVLLLSESSCRTIANFHIGSRVTAVAWSSHVSSPSLTDDWSIELAVAGADYSLYLLSKSATTEEEIFPFGGGLSGHHGKVNDMTFCGGRSEDSSRYVATVSDDKMLMVWDLSPNLNIASPPSPGMDPPPALNLLHTVNSHPSTSKELLVADCRGSIFLTDWRSDPDENEQDSWRNSSVVELVEPRALAYAASGLSNKWAGSVAWRRDATADIVGAAYGSRFALWDMGNLFGGKPYMTGTSFAEGGHLFRWCPTYPDYFALSTSSPAKGAVVHVHNVTYTHAQPTVFQIAPRPLYVRSFDFVAARGIPRIVAAVGREVIVFYIGVDS
ncbi:hypothetical protein C8Q80DRAFT_1168378 [Daedaleopsis nitida]|nr:hypothetical protein C8Q80DRAFT_1168378 [Daedaleopsis nitida]